MTPTPSSTSVKTASSPHDVLLVVKQRIPHPAYVVPLELDVERIHHKLALAHIGTRDDAEQRTRLVARRLHVLRSLHHRHLTVGCHRAGAAGRIRGLPDVRVRDRYRRSGRRWRLADVGEHHAHPAAPLVGDSPEVDKRGLAHVASLTPPLPRHSARRGRTRRTR